jgi:hypothetical protein
MTPRLAILPTGAPDYRNRAVYAPTVTILRNALGDKCPSFKRPKGSKGRQRKEFMWPEQAFAIIDEAAKIDPEFELYLLVLLYNGIRKGEGLKAMASDTRPEDLALWLPTHEERRPAHAQAAAGYREAAASPHGGHSRPRQAV